MVENILILENIVTFINTALVKQSQS